MTSNDKEHNTKRECINIHLNAMPVLNDEAGQKKSHGCGVWAGLSIRKIERGMSLVDAWMRGCVDVWIYSRGSPNHEVTALLLYAAVDDMMLDTMLMVMLDVPLDIVLDKMLIDSNADDLNNAVELCTNENSFRDN